MRPVPALVLSYWYWFSWRLNFDWNRGERKHRPESKYGCFFFFFLCCRKQIHSCAMCYVAYFDRTANSLAWKVYQRHKWGKTLNVRPYITKGLDQSFFFLFFYPPTPCLTESPDLPRGDLPEHVIIYQPPFSLPLSLWFGATLTLSPVTAKSQCWAQRVMWCLHARVGAHFKDMWTSSE